MSSAVEKSPRVLRNWYPFRRFSRSAREVREYLVGAIYGDPSREDGTIIVTTAILRRAHNVAVSASGTRYLLEAQGFGPAIRQGGAGVSLLSPMQSGM